MISKEVRAKALFEQYDRDGSGTISLSEFQSLLPSLGINLSLPKSIEYFRLCDENDNGQIDFEEFKAALFVCDSEELNPSGFNPGSMLRPKDAFGMFDKDSSGNLGEDEFHFALNFLQIEIDEQIHEKMFAKYDRDKSGFIEYGEFKKIWLRLANPIKELEDRGIHIPTLATKAQMIRMLDRVLDDEEKKEAIAIKEAKRFRKEQILLQSRKKDIENARNRSYMELCSALDAAGQVYVFGNGTLNQFCRGKMDKPTSTSPQLYEEDVNDLLTKLWKSRVRGKALGENTEQDYPNETQTEAYVRSKPFPFEGLNIQENSVSLWGKNVIGVAVGDSSIIAHTGRGEVYTWGGNSQWWHEIEAESYLQEEPRNPQLTARSSLMQGRHESNERDRRSLLDQNMAPEHTRNVYQGTSATPVSLSTTVNGDQYNIVKRVLQYYGIWTTPEDSIDPQEHSGWCVQNLVTPERLQLSLQIRGKSCTQMTKMKMFYILHEEIDAECKMLGEVAHLHLRELEAEIAELRRKRKLKMAKRRQVEFTDRRRSIKKTMNEDIKVSVRNENIETIPIRSNILQTKPLTAAVSKVSSLASPSTRCWSMIASGSNHTGLLDNNGTLFMYGLNTAGRLGLNTSRDASSHDTNNQKDVYQPTAVVLPDSAKVSHISCGHSHTSAVSNGNLFTWGSTAAGKLGLGDFESGRTCVLSPAKVPFFKEEINIVSCGSNHTACVTKTHGNLFVWGCNGGGKLGLGDVKDRHHPTIVESLSSVTIVDVSCGNCQTLACSAIHEMKSLVNNSEVIDIYGGAVFVAGQGGCLGSSFKTFGKYDSFIMHNEPIPPKPIRHISAGFSHQAAVSIDGELFAWGDNRGGSSCQPHPSFHFIPKPMFVDCLYNKPHNLGTDKPTHESSPYGNQPFYEIDLQEQSTIQEIMLWNKLAEPKNPAIRKEEHTTRLFPCWIMISQKPFPPSAGEGALCQALKNSVTHKRLTANKHCSIWHPPRKTMGRYVRVQLEKMDLLEFEKLEVFGNPGIDNSTARVSSVTCGKQGT